MAVVDPDPPEQIEQIEEFEEIPSPTPSPTRPPPSRKPTDVAKVVAVAATDALVTGGYQTEGCTVRMNHHLISMSRHEVAFAMAEFGEKIKMPDEVGVVVVSRWADDEVPQEALRVWMFVASGGSLHEGPGEHRSSDLKCAQRLDSVPSILVKHLDIDVELLANDIVTLGGVGDDDATHDDTEKRLVPTRDEEGSSVSHETIASSE